MYCKLRNDAVKDLAKDTVYTHPTAQQCEIPLATTETAGLMSPADKLRLSTVQYNWTNLGTEQIDIPYTGGTQSFTFEQFDPSAYLLMRIQYSLSGSLVYIKPTNSYTVHVIVATNIGGYTLYNRETDDTTHLNVTISLGASGTIYCMYNQNDKRYHYYRDQALSNELAVSSVAPTYIRYTFTKVQMSGSIRIDPTDMTGTVNVKVVV